MMMIYQYEHAQKKGGGYCDITNVATNDDSTFLKNYDYFKHMQEKK